MTKTVHVPGISCGHCVMTIEKELDDLDGVEDVKAEHASKEPYEGRVKAPTLGRDVDLKAF